MTSDSSTLTKEDAVRNLIVCDTQFGWNGETSLQLPEMLDLQARGWLIEGDDNKEFSLTTEGHAVVSRALQQATVRRQYAADTTFQAGVAGWMERCFLPSLYSNMTERGDRLLEEVLELLQAHGYDSARVATLVNYVYGRPLGEPAQEVGGVMVTLAGYCWVAGLDMHAAGAAELSRIQQPDVMEKIRRKQEAKNALHFDTPLPGNADAGPLAVDGQDWPRAGDLVRYNDGASALAIRGGPHAGGWHGDQCCGGSVFFMQAYKPSAKDLQTWLDCARYRNGHTADADARITEELHQLGSAAEVTSV